MIYPFDRVKEIGRKWWIAAAIYFVCGTVFVIDINDIQLIPYGIFYLPLVGTAVFYRNPRMVWVLSVIASAMVVVGYFLPVISESAFESAMNRGGSIVAIFVTAGLLHYTRQTQEALAKATLRAERGDQAKARLLTNLSRELVIPLNSIIGFSEMLQENGSEEQQEFIGYVLASGRGLLNTFRNLIDVTTGERRHLQTIRINLRPLLQKVMRAALVEAAKRRVSLDLAAAEPLPEVRGDPWAIKRIIENLLSNAVKFSNPDGKVTVSLTLEGNQIALVVQDNGIGMTPEVVARLGELFFQADTGGLPTFEGMGAGLALSRQLAAAMDADLRFDSTPGQGTTVRLAIPVPQDSRAFENAFDRLRASSV